MSSRRSLALSLLVLCAVAASFATSCNVSHCEDLRDELSALKQKWQACQTDFDCTIVGGNVKDCTGILSCNTAVNKLHRLEAERRIASLPEETVDCVLCKSPNCVDGIIPLCDQTTKTCIIVTEIIEPPPEDMPDAGEGPDAGGGPDASTGDAG
jgi:hypothetical protein